MTINENGYNKVQLNETINQTADGRIVSRSIMINVREESAEKAWDIFSELKKKVEDKPEKKVKNSPGKEKKEKKGEQKKDNPGICQKCGAPLLEKQGLSSKNGKPYHFFSCSAWPICSYSEPFLPKEEKKRLEKMPCDEDLIPF